MYWILKYVLVYNQNAHESGNNDIYSLVLLVSTSPYVILRYCLYLIYCQLTTMRVLINEDSKLFWTECFLVTQIKALHRILFTWIDIAH
jgi:hypothetical protein